MAEHELEKLRYPIGRFQQPNEYSKPLIDNQIELIKTFPSALATHLATLSQAELETPYRPGGWTVRQVVHHCADSHMNGFIRHKLALTEENPIIKPYLEGLWSEMKDNKTLPTATSLHLLEALHTRWAFLLLTLSEADFSRSYFHPEHQRQISLFESVALYAWHSHHHLGHVRLVLGK